MAESFIPLETPKPDNSVDQPETESFESGQISEKKVSDFIDSVKCHENKQLPQQKIIVLLPHAFIWKKTKELVSEIEQEHKNIFQDTINRIDEAIQASEKIVAATVLLVNDALLRVGNILVEKMNTDKKEVEVDDINKCIDFLKERIEGTYLSPLMILKKYIRELRDMSSLAHMEPIHIFYNFYRCIDTVKHFLKFSCLKNNKATKKEVKPYLKNNPNLSHKTVMCKYHVIGLCTRGDNCPFAHSREEFLKYNCIPETVLSLANERPRYRGRSPSRDYGNDDDSDYSSSPSPCRYKKHRHSREDAEDYKRYRRERSRSPERKHKHRHSRRN